MLGEGRGQPYDVKTWAVTLSGILTVSSSEPGLDFFPLHKLFWHNPIAGSHKKKSNPRNTIQVSPLKLSGIKSNFSAYSDITDPMSMRH